MKYLEGEKPTSLQRNYGRSRQLPQVSWVGQERQHMNNMN
jgi:hypothetical protein